MQPAPNAVHSWRDLVPAAVGLSVFCAFAALYLHAPDIYRRIFHFLDVPAFAFPFLDTEFIFTMKECWDKGVDIYANITCDTIPGNRMPYSPLWPRLPLPTDKDLFRAPFGVGVGLLFLASLSMLPPRRKSWADVAMLSVAVLSPMVVFALERGNVDVWIYLALVLATMLLTRSLPARLVAYSLLLFTGLLKFYPLVSLVVAAREGLKRVCLVGLASALVVAVFVALLHGELVRALANVPRGDAYGSWIGIVNLAQYGASRVLEPAGYSPQAIAAATAALRAALTLLVLFGGILISRRNDVQSALTRMDEADRLWLVLGASVMAGCYLLGQSFAYRGVFLLPVVAGLLAFRRRADAPLRTYVGLLTTLALSLMWVDAARHWTEAGPNPGARVLPFVRGMLWRVREIGWLVLSQALLGVIFAFLAQSQSGRDLRAFFAREGGAGRSPDVAPTSENDAS